MLPLILAVSGSSSYPLLLGVPSSVSAPTAESLGIPGTLPENLTVFIAVPTPDAPLTDLRSLSAWGNASTVCARAETTLAFPAVDSSFNFVDTVRGLYPAQMSIDTATECTCKVRHFRGGLLTIRVIEEEISAVRVVTQGLPAAMPYAFVVDS
jgi:hypothetical protein